MKLFKDGGNAPLPAKALRLLQWGYRLRTSASRALPDFYIIGAQKGGTTSLYRYLEQHPQICGAFQKEPQYFGYYYAQRPQFWYRAHFPYRETLAAEGQFTGEASTHYLMFPNSATRIKAVTPEAKIIVLLRDPTERLFSAWRHNYRKGHDKRDFEVAIRSEMEKPVEAHIAEMRDPRNETRHYANHSYLAHSLYAAQLKHWLSCFDEKRFLVMKSEVFFGDIASSYQKVTRFLGVGDWLPDEPFQPFMVGLNQTLDDALRQEIRDYLKEPTIALNTLMGEDFGWY